jgi:hypothetical protein
MIPYFMTNYLQTIVLVSKCQLIWWRLWHAVFLTKLVSFVTKNTKCSKMVHVPQHWSPGTTILCTKIYKWHLILYVNNIWYIARTWPREEKEKNKRRKTPKSFTLTFNVCSPHRSHVCMSMRVYGHVILVVWALMLFHSTASKSMNMDQKSIMYCSTS